MENGIHLKQATLDGKLIGYHSKTMFYVQVGKGCKASYKNVASFEGNLYGAVMHYSGINIGNGYKKRLFAPSMNKPTLAKDKSF